MTVFLSIDCYGGALSTSHEPILSVRVRGGLQTLKHGVPWPKRRVGSYNGAAARSLGLD